MKVRKGRYAIQIDDIVPESGITMRVDCERHIVNVSSTGDLTTIGLELFI